MFGVQDERLCQPQKHVTFPAVNTISTNQSSGLQLLVARVNTIVDYANDASDFVPLSLL